METSVRTACPEAGYGKLPHGVQCALTILLEAYQYAKDLEQSHWDFAVESSTLFGAGPTPSDLRWLLCQGLVTQAIERTQPGASRRAFQPVANLSLSSQACLVLTKTGVAVAQGLGSRPADLHLRSERAVPEKIEEAVPHWDAQRRELRWGDYLIKMFKVPAPNQELVLNVFEEEGWPPCIDDPLSSDANQDPKERLHDTIKNLNRHQVERLIYFRGNGSGNGVRWELRSKRCD